MEMKYYQQISGLISTLICVLILLPAAEAADKTWSGSGDGTSWSDDDNWSPAVAPTSADAVSIDTEETSVVCDETFSAKSVTIGGRETSTLTSSNFIYGTVTPDSTSDIAISNRKDGKFTLQGAGIVTVKGQYKDSEESLISEPSFMFWIR